MSTLWTLRRGAADVVSCVGELWQGPSPEVRTLERGLAPEATNPRVPAGTYGLVLKSLGSSHFDKPYSAIFGSMFKGMVELVGVPGRSEILIHCGNVYTDSLGCILVGADASHGPNGWELQHSQAAFRAVYPVLVGQIGTGGAVLQIVEIGASS